MKLYFSPPESVTSRALPFSPRSVKLPAFPWLSLLQIPLTDPVKAESFCMQTSVLEFLWMKASHLKSIICMAMSAACKYTRQDREKYDPKRMFKFRLILPPALFPLVLIQECIDRKLSFQALTILNLVPMLIKQEKIRQCNKFGEQAVEGER